MEDVEEWFVKTAPGSLRCSPGEETLESGGVRDCQ